MNHCCLKTTRTTPPHTHSVELFLWTAWIIYWKILKHHISFMVLLNFFLTKSCGKQITDDTLGNGIAQHTSFPCPPPLSSILSLSFSCSSSSLAFLSACWFFGAFAQLFCTIHLSLFFPKPGLEHHFEKISSGHTCISCGWEVYTFSSYAHISIIFFLSKYYRPVAAVFHCYWNVGVCVRACVRSGMCVRYF